MSEKKLSEELRHCMDGNGCKDCKNYTSVSRLTCPSLMQKAYEKIKEYEELESDERLIKLPCNIGDTLYWINSKRKRVFY